MAIRYFKYLRRKPSRENACRVFNVQMINYAGCHKKLYFDAFTRSPSDNYQVSQRYVFIFSESSYFHLTFGINLFKIGSKFAQQWLPKAAISGPADDRRPDLFEKCTNLKQPYCFIKVRWSVKVS